MKKKIAHKGKNRTRGRKTRCTAELQARFFEALTKYHTFKHACVAAGIGESTFYLWLLKGMAGEEPYVEFLELLQLARARVRVFLADEISTDKDWRAKAWLKQHSNGASNDQQKLDHFRRHAPPEVQRRYDSLRSEIAEIDQAVTDRSRS